MTMALRSDRPGDARYGQPGDQETLALTLRRYARDRVRAIPKDLVRLRLSDGDGPALVMHWTGPVGKEHISRAMEQAPADGVAGDESTDTRVDAAHSAPERAETPATRIRRDS